MAVQKRETFQIRSEEDIVRVRQVVRDLRVADARRLARHALSLATAAEVEQYLFDALAASVEDAGRR